VKPTIHEIRFFGRGSAPDNTDRGVYPQQPRHYSHSPFTPHSCSLSFSPLSSPSATCSIIPLYSLLPRSKPPTLKPVMGLGSPVSFAMGRGIHTCKPWNKYSIIKLPKLEGRWFCRSGGNLIWINDLNYTTPLNCCQNFMQRRDGGDAFPRYWSSRRIYKCRPHFWVQYLHYMVFLPCDARSLWS